MFFSLFSLSLPLYKLTVTVGNSEAKKYFPPMLLFNDGVNIAP